MRIFLSSMSKHVRRLTPNEQLRFYNAILRLLISKVYQMKRWIGLSSTIAMNCPVSRPCRYKRARGWSGGDRFLLAPAWLRRYGRSGHRVPTILVCRGSDGIAGE